ncbi:hypothetical protein L228DRAFT_245277 [Xylona heveae TC161]|uniref:Nucleoporin Nup159/Nup146 N-terminal domain-containing protein n=1 Tax=Xylona heveae (strain CBS 132557 / TC161) TaxID=1328760 RepID=A0A165I428_XYLHT|nr:hypothetical protein L228DRAFT_245277 [Xylona heveae TC161]KZF24354.1 hypothetical protein L228DRAFT_245277 [Xylona heveae TC161]
MALSFGSSPGASPFAASMPGSASGPAIQTGSDLAEILTEGLGFLSLAGDAKVRLLPSPWPEDSLPPPTSNLFSIASKKGLIAAAGPDAIVIAGTDAVRQAFKAEGSEAVKPFSPQLKIDLGMRVSQLVFSADENYLVISAENGGGLAVYDVQALMQGDTQSAFELPTNGAALRALSPNPLVDKAELFAVVTTSGDLLMANLKERNFVTGPGGQVLKSGVSCVSWSKRGKQLVAGLGDGTCYQMTPDGAGKAQIPRPPALEGDQHVSSIFWLDTSVFLTIHTPTSSPEGETPESTYNLVTSNKERSSFAFQKFVDPCPPFGLPRSPPHHFIARMENFPPNLQDVLIVSSTASPDINLFTSSSVPLSSDLPAGEITNIFTLTGMAKDERRAQLPMSETASDTSPIGVALDLSSKEKVDRPIPGEEIDQSQTPLPALMVLNNEGVLSAWWFVYSESVREGTAYPELTIVGGGQQAAAQATPQPAASASPFAAASSPQPTKSIFGQSSFGSGPAPSSSFGGAGAFGKPSAPSFGSPSMPATNGAFGSPASLGAKASPWGSNNTASPTAAPGFGKPTFGSSTAFGAPAQGGAFGTPGGLGNRPSPWGAPASTTSPGGGGAAFGQTSSFGLGANSAPKPFGSSTGAGSGGIFGSGASSAGSGFASFANKGGFAAAAQNQGTGGSIFGQSTSGTGFSGTTANDSAFGASNKTGQTPGGAFGSGGGFKLGSTFQGDDTAKDDAQKPASTDGSLFGSGFGNVLGEAATAKSAESEAPEADMDADVSDAIPAEPAPKEPEPTTPAAAPAAPTFGLPTAPPATTGLFGTQAQTSTTPATVQSSKPTSIFGQPSTPSAPFSFIKPAAKEPEKPKEEPQEKGPEKPAETPEEPVKDSIEQPPTEKPVEEPRREPTPPPKEPTPPPVSVPSSPEVKREPEEPETPIVDRAIPSPSLPPGSAKTPATEKSEVPWSSPFASSPAVRRSSANNIPLPQETAESVPQSPEEESPARRESEAESREEEPFDDEGSGVDVGKDLSPIDDQAQSSQSLYGRSEESPTTSGWFQEPKQQQKQQQAPLKPLFGSFGQPPKLAQPTKPLEASPRSPSPFRNSIQNDKTRAEGFASLSTSGLPSQKTGPRRTVVQPPLPDDLAQRQEERKRAEERRTAELARRAEEEQELSDREDEKVREELSTDVQGALELSPFLAHQDYIGHVEKPGIPGQIERVYRDINSMIDTLGLNARSLEAFIKGHTENYKEGGRSRDDLEDAEGWCLIEIEDLTLTETKLERDLESGRIHDVQGKLNACRELQRDLVRLRAKHHDIKKLIDARSDPDELAMHRSAPLSAEQAVQQHDLRRDLQKFQKLLTEVEEGISVLKAKVVAQGAGRATPSPSMTGSALSTSRPQAQPTMEAVMNTINKMTSMVERKSGDIDVLENQMRKLRFSSVTSNSSAPGSSRESSPFGGSRMSSPPPQAQSSYHPLSSSIRSRGACRTPRTPGTGAGAYGTPRTSGTGLFYTPDSSRSTPRAHPLSASINGSAVNGSAGLQETPLTNSSFRKSGFMGSVSGSHAGQSPSPYRAASVAAASFDPEDLQRYQAKIARRKEVSRLLKDALVKAGPKVRGAGAADAV